MEPTPERMMWMYENMLLIREYEETMAKVYLEGKLPPNIQKGLAFDIGQGLDRILRHCHAAARQIGRIDDYLIGGRCIDR